MHPTAQPQHPALQPEDAELLARFEVAALSPAEYGHREHVRTAWLYLRERGAEGARAAVCDGIRRLSAAHGAPGRYHETLTRLWIALVDGARRASPSLGFEELLRVHPVLLDREAPFRFYSPERLWSEEARAGWVEPDREPLPASPEAPHSAGRLRQEQGSQSARTRAGRAAASRQGGS
jgi:hypothetical protein